MLVCLNISLNKKQRRDALMRFIATYREKMYINKKILDMADKIDIEIIAAACINYTSSLMIL